MAQPPDEPRFLEIGSGLADSADDVVGPGRLGGFGRGRPLVVLLVVALAVGAGLGYLAGRFSAASAAKAEARVVTVTPTPSPVMSGAFAETGARCSAQIGRRLELGAEVRNELDGPVTLLGVSAALPLGGLQLASSGRGACGELPGADREIVGYRIPVGGSTWFTMTFNVLVDCPEPLPVLISVKFRDAHSLVKTAAVGFPDLVAVPYSGCR